jgi:catechol-2,3-dioxygenase
MESMETAPITGVSHVVLDVSNIEESVAWYMKVLGLRLDRGEPGRYVGLTSSSGQFRLGLFMGGIRGNRGALNHIAFSVSGLEALERWVGHLTVVGVAHEGIKQFALGYSVDLFDPDGNNVELVAES